MQGSDLSSQTLTTALFQQTLVCEADRPSDLDGDPTNNLCFDLSPYVIPNVLQGSPVTIKSTSPPTGTHYVGVAFDPLTSDDAAFVSAGSQGTVKLNTTDHPDLTIHYFFAPIPPTATPTATRTATPVPTATKSPTRTKTPSAPTSTPKPGTATNTPIPTVPDVQPTEGNPTDTPTVLATSYSSPTSPGTGQTGTLQLFVRACLGDGSLTDMNALAPGVVPTLTDYGDATCTYGTGQIQISDPGGAVLQTVTVPENGTARVPDLPVLANDGSYTATDLASGASGTFLIASGLTTSVLSLNYQPDDYVDDGPWTPGPGDVDDPTETATPDESNANYTPVDPDDVPYFGPEAGPSGGDPFVVNDDPEAVANVQAVTAFQDLPGVGTGPAESTSDNHPGAWLAAGGLALLLAAVELFMRSRKPR